MKVYLAGAPPFMNEGLYAAKTKETAPFILESFFYANGLPPERLKNFGDYLLDSGAFTFMTGKAGKEIIWEEYVDRYADYINSNNVEKFFELDIDVLTSYEEVKKLRARLEKKTGKKCIPVWHKSRGKDEFLHMADEYPYVALGGIVSKEWSTEEYRYFPWFIQNAHHRKAKIHGLGFTQLKYLSQYHFDSVDSTAWTSGNRFGIVYEFNGETMVRHMRKDKGKTFRIADARGVALHNFSEWIKFQKYAETNL